MNFKSLRVTLLVLGISFASPGKAQPAKPPRTITITAHRFAFDPAEITLKKGEEVVLILQSKDVTHGLVIEELGVRIDIKKGQPTEVKFTPETAGTFEGRCIHFCGAGHGSMTLTVHVEE
jgi:cytochrome c oxidase subunit 2